MKFSRPITTFKTFSTAGLAMALVGTMTATNFSPSLAQEDPFASVKVTTEEVVPGVYMLQGAGGNIGLSVGDDGPFIIDDQFAPLSGRILEAIGKVTDKAPNFVLNTHWHGDHTGGNENFDAAGAIIVAHDNVRKRLKEGREGARPIPPAAEGALPVITFSEQMTFHWNGHEIFIHHPEPAHTDGDAIVFFKDINVVHMGDVFFKGGYPFVDLNSGGDLEGYIKAYDVVLDIIDENTKIIPGHGSLANKEDLTASRDMMVQVRDEIQKAIDKGWSREKTVKKAPLKKLSKTWGQSFIKDEFMTTTAYDSLTRE